MLDYTDHDAAAMHADWNDHDALFSAMEEVRRAGFWLSRASTTRAKWWEVWGSEVLICFPFSGSTYCNKACVWNWQTKLWGLRDLTDVTYGASGQLDFATSGTWAADPDAWDWDETTWTGNDYAPNEARLLLTTTTAIKAFDVGATDDGSSGLPGALQRTGMTLDDPYSMKLVRAVYPRVDGPAGSVVTVRVGAAMNADQSVSWSDAVSFTIGSSIKADSFAQGRFVAVEFSASVPFRVRSFDLDVVATGAY